MIYNLDAERALLAECLMNNANVDQASAIVNAGDFWEAHHGAIWQAINGIIKDNRKADIVSVDDYMGQNSPGIAYLAEMCRDVVTQGAAVHCAGIIKDKSRRRAIEGAIRGLFDDLHKNHISVPEIIDTAQERLSALIGDSDRPVTELREWLPEWIDLLERRSRGEESELGLSTGYPELDEYFRMRPGELHILAGESGMGKTVAACNLINSVSMIQGRTSLMFQLEMSRGDVWERIVSAYSGARGRFMKDPMNTPGDDWPQISTAVARGNESNIVIDDRQGLTMAQIRGQAKRWRDHWGEIGLLMIDYVGLVEAADKRISREQQISEIARACKNMAKELDCHVVLMAQINRENTKRVDKRPMPTDLRESAALQHNADIISLLYRDEHYNPESDKRGILEWIIGKNRKGPRGTVDMVCDLSRSRLEPFSAESLDRWRRDHPMVKVTKNEDLDGTF